MRFKKGLVLTGVLALAAWVGAAYGAPPLVIPTWAESHPDLTWGMSLADFRALKGSKITFSVPTMEARAMDYFLMDYHEINKEDPARQPFFSVQAIPGDPTFYFFYRDKLRMIADTVPLKNFQDTEDRLKTQYHLLKYTLYESPNDFSDSNGSFRTFFHVSLYNESPTTQLALIKVTGYYENELYYFTGYSLYKLTTGAFKAAYLVHLEKGYLDGDNAYTDWLANRKNPPKTKTWLEQYKSAIEN